MSDTITRTRTSTWTIDPVHSNVEFSVKHLMISKVRGRFHDVAATLRVDEENPDRSAVEAEIDVASIDTKAADRDGHLRSPDFFDVQNHPKITFRSTRLDGAHAEPGDRFSLAGDLTIRGITKEIVLDAVFEGRAEDPWGGQRMGFQATGEIVRSDFGLTWNQALESGGLLLGDRIRLEVEVQFVEQAA